MAGRKTLAITGRQFEALRILWEQGPLTVRQLMERLPRGDRQPYTTVLGLLQNMEKAGLVSHREEGLTYRYEPTVSRQEATAELLRDYVTRFFRGSAEALVLGLEGFSAGSSMARTIAAERYLLETVLRRPVVVKPMKGMPVRPRWPARI